MGLNPATMANAVRLLPALTPHRVPFGTRATASPVGRARQTVGA